MSIQLYQVIEEETLRRDFVCFDSMSHVAAPRGVKTFDAI